MMPTDYMQATYSKPGIYWTYVTQKKKKKRKINLKSIFSFLFSFFSAWK
jgi:hypothetical protein